VCLELKLKTKYRVGFGWMRGLKGGKQHEEINESVCCLLLMEREKSEEVAK
jgi:hypothetical protein